MQLQDSSLPPRSAPVVARVIEEEGIDFARPEWLPPPTAAGGAQDERDAGVYAGLFPDWFELPPPADPAGEEAAHPG